MRGGVSDRHDIRDGPELECIQCALCIDACDEIMDQIGRPRGLIAYDTSAISRPRYRIVSRFNCFRPRVILYGTAMAIVGVIMLTALLLRPELDVNVLHDRNPLYVTV